MSLLDQFLGWFGRQPQEDPDPAATALLLRVVILFEVANFDHNFSPKERDFIVRLLCDKHGCSVEQADHLLVLAKKRRNEDPDLFHFTRQINDLLGIEEKVDLMTEVWQVIFADDEVEHHEQVLAGRLKNLLRLGQTQWIEARQRAQKLSQPDA